MRPTTLMKRTDAKSNHWVEKQKFGPTLSLYTRTDGANKEYMYFVVKAFAEGQEANLDLEGADDGSRKGGFISFLEGPKEDNFISGQITAGSQNAGRYPLFLDTCFDPERGIAISGGFGSYLIWALAYDFDRNESVILNPDRQMILSESTLGSSVLYSDLKKVGTLDNLDVAGNANLGSLFTNSIFAFTYYNLPPLDPFQLSPLTLDAANFRVGVSNPLPQYALDVFGDVNVADGFTFKVNGIPLSTSVAPLTLDTTNNRVGVNKTDPQSALDVVGNLAVSGTSVLGDVMSTSLGCMGTVTCDTVDAQHYLNLPVSNVLPLTLDTTNNRVGINKTVPTQALDVVGTVHVTGGILANDVACATVNASGSVIAGASLESFGELTVDGPSYLTDVFSNTLTNTGRVETGTLYAASYENLPTPSVLPITLDTVNGRVGINDTTPSQALDVTGAIRATGDVIVNDTLIKSNTGAPEGVRTAPVGSLYMRKDGGAGTSLYIKESGTGATGWKTVGGSPPSLYLEQTNQVAFSSQSNSTTGAIQTIFTAALEGNRRYTFAVDVIGYKASTATNFTSIYLSFDVASVLTPVANPGPNKPSTGVHNYRYFKTVYFLTAAAAQNQKMFSNIYDTIIVPDLGGLTTQVTVGIYFADATATPAGSYKIDIGDALLRVY